MNMISQIHAQATLSLRNNRKPVYRQLESWMVSDADLNVACGRNGLQLIHWANGQLLPPFVLDTMRHCMYVQNTARIFWIQP